MDTYMTVTAYGEKAQDAVDAAEAEIERLDTLLSTGNADSEIAKLNEQKSATLSEDGGYWYWKCDLWSHEPSVLYIIYWYWCYDDFRKLHGKRQKSYRRSN